jgi:hypothetical protein
MQEIKYNGYELLVVHIYSLSSELDTSEETQLQLQKKYGEDLHGRKRRHTCT